jgi:hypothetical protein
MLGGAATLREQLADQRSAGLEVLRGATLRIPYAALLRRQTQFVVFDPHHDFIPGLDAEGFAKGRRNYHAPILVDPASSFFHVTLPQFMT